MVKLTLQTLSLLSLSVFTADHLRPVLSYISDRLMVPIEVLVD